MRKGTSLKETSKGVVFLRKKNFACNKSLFAKKKKEKKGGFLNNLDIVLSLKNRSNLNHKVQFGLLTFSVYLR